MTILHQNAVNRYYDWIGLLDWRSMSLAKALAFLFTFVFISNILANGHCCIFNKFERCEFNNDWDLL